jgi:drug/metabolite transporter (DMT)-like permease
MAAGMVPASEITFLRAISATAILLPSAMQHGSLWLKREAGGLWARSGIGALSVLCLAWNLQHTSVGLANTLFNLAPILVVTLGAFLGYERLQLRKVISVSLVVLASAIFWHGSRVTASAAVWAVGIFGMCVAAVAYAMLKGLPSVWRPTDITWCLNLATMPVALGFALKEVWVVPMKQSLWLVVAICGLSLVGNALANLSFRFLELSTATALIPSAIVWGVVLDMGGKHHFPAVQGVIGCLLYVAATLSLVARRPQEAR